MMTLMKTEMCLIFFISYAKVIKNYIFVLSFFFGYSMQIKNYILFIKIKNINLKTFVHPGYNN